MTIEHKEPASSRLPKKEQGVPQPALGCDGSPPPSNPALLLRPGESLRDQLITDMGLEFDPFRTSFSDDDFLPFEEIYVDPPTEQDAADMGVPLLIDRLQEQRHTFVFANYGMGKTATWHALEYLLRMARVEQPVLVVRYTPRLPADGAHIPASDTYSLDVLAREMVVDLLIQSLERSHDRFPRSGPPSTAQQDVLRRLYAAAPGQLKRAIRNLADEQPDETTNWSGLRPNILLRTVAPAWRAWLAALVAPLPRRAGPAMSWQELSQAALQLGFACTFVLVDAVDERSIDIRRQMSVLAPIIERLRPFEQARLFVKGFLPLELGSILKHELHDRFEGLTVQPELATIARRTPEHLYQILDQRLSAAAKSSSSFKSLDWFRSPEIGESIQERIITLADGSPRRLIQLVSLLLDEHSAHGYHTNRQIELSATDWQHFLTKAATHLPSASPPPE
ncbi:hypothetical protein EKD04_015705 [Chloroflexales bacterium ZM16-3]|nr:hypothetical protein [Chloroflexales bacterium ZM16-3]